MLLTMYTSLLILLNFISRVSNDYPSQPQAIPVANNNGRNSLDKGSASNFKKGKEEMVTRKNPIYGLRMSRLEEAMMDNNSQYYKAGEQDDTSESGYVYDELSEKKSWT